MGIWEKAQSVAKKVADNMQEQTARYEEYLEEFEDASDEELIRIAKSNLTSANPRRIAAIRILSGRGYTNI